MSVKEPRQAPKKRGRPVEKSSPIGNSGPFLVILIVLALIAYGTIQALSSPAHVVDKYLIGGLVVLALAFAGYGGDRLIDMIADRFKR